MPERQHLPPADGGRKPVAPPPKPSDARRSVTSPRAWLDKNNVPCFRADVTLEEASELQDMLGDAFNAGVISGFVQASDRIRG